MTEDATATRQTVACPECGTPATITVNRRDSEDFCTRCDFPLFWTPAAVVLDGAAGLAEAGLRRLPGTAGRVTVASVPCPTCAEANPVAAETCLRCGGPMVLPEPEPEPLPPPSPAPEPVPEPEPAGVGWWVWLVGGATLVALVVLIVIISVR